MLGRTESPTTIAAIPFASRKLLIVKASNSAVLLPSAWKTVSRPIRPEVEVRADFTFGSSRRLNIQQAKYQLASLPRIYRSTDSSMDRKSWARQTPRRSCCSFTCNQPGRRGEWHESCGISVVIGRRHGDVVCLL